MTNILVLTGQLRNYGDHLIALGTTNLFRNAYSSHNITFSNRHNPPPLPLDAYDKVFISGGPFLKEPLLIGNKVFNNCPISLSNVQLIGGGLKCPINKLNQPIPSFSPKTLRLLKSMKRVGCRDLDSVYVLRNFGVNAFYSGCPAWFGYHHWRDSPNYRLASSPSKVVFTAPQSDLYLEQMCELVERLNRIYSVAVCFNKGFETVAQTSTVSHLKSLNIECYDTSGPDSFPKILNTSHWHIGYRVHSHVAALSMGIPSSLFAEDCRAVCMNKTLGIDWFSAKTTNYHNSFDQINYERACDDMLIALKHLPSLSLSSYHFLDMCNE